MRNHLVTNTLAALLAVPLFAARADAVPPVQPNPTPTSFESINPNSAIGEIAAAAEVELDWNFSVGPNLDADILVGETIRWTWTDTLLHSVTSTSGPTSFDSGLIQGFGTMYSETFTQVGTWDYECSNHGGIRMGGVITVPEPGAPLMLLSGGAFLAILGRRRYAT